MFSIAVIVTAWTSWLKSGLDWYLPAILQERVAREVAAIVAKRERTGVQTNKVLPHPLKFHRWLWWERGGYHWCTLIVNWGFRDCGRRPFCGFGILIIIIIIRVEHWNEPPFRSNQPRIRPNQGLQLATVGH